MSPPIAPDPHGTRRKPRSRPEDHVAGGPRSRWPGWYSVPLNSQPRRRWGPNRTLFRPGWLTAPEPVYNRPLLTTFREPERVRESVAFGVDPNTPVSPWGTHSHGCEPRARCLAATVESVASWRDLAARRFVNHCAREVAYSSRQWLPEANGLANSVKREQSAFPVPPGCSLGSKSVGLGTEQDSNSNSSGVRSQRSRELWCAAG